MDRLYKPEKIRQEPLITICWIIALAAIIGSAYILSPWLLIADPNGGIAIFNTLASTIGLYMISAAAFASGATIVTGILKNNNKIIRVGLGANLFLRFYILMVSLIVYGLPQGFIASLTLIAIILVVYFAIGRRR